MPIDYKSIRTENERKYGTDIGRIGGMLLADRYDERTHFIFEILQNAEDALKKRIEWDGPRSVEFSLSADALTISHFGKPFDEADVRGICGIGESTKQELTDIGRFGIGFKSVYALTDSAEIHSGEEHFAIDSYVWPRAAAGTNLRTEETQIHIPFRANKDSEILARDEVLTGLQRLREGTLLFLREIEEISWSADSGHSGLFKRISSEVLGSWARKVLTIGQNNASTEVRREWLIFSREVFHEGKSAGYAEIAFALSQDGEDNQHQSVVPIANSPLVVFFPTILPTHLGFVVQGPYRTTPSRDNIPQDDPWNKHLVQETAILLIDALTELRQLEQLDVPVLQCLPLEASRFTERSNRLFAPLFPAVKEALRTEPLLPAYNGGYIAGQNAILAGTQAIRELIGSEQLAALFSESSNPVWLNSEITADRTPELRRYLINELEITEATPDWLVPRLTAEFLEAQPDEWIERLYGFLNGQGALLQRLRARPLVRLENGSHVIAVTDGNLQAYLPGSNQTDFPTVKRDVCQTSSPSEER